MGTRRAARWLRRTFLRQSDAPKLSAGLAAKERVVRVPEMSRAMARAIYLIAPQYRHVTGAALREAWERDQNIACWSEYEALAPALKELPPSPRVLELGPGMGRSLIFLSKTLGWRDAELHAWEGEGTSTKYTMLGPRFSDSFCGNFAQLRAMLSYNGTADLTIHDAATTPLNALPGPFDLVYSFYSVGFHWALEHFIDEILPLVKPGGVAAFTLAEGFTLPPQIADVPHAVVSAQSVYADRPPINILVLRP